MSQFSLDVMTPVTIQSVNVRSELHGDEHVPAVDVAIKLDTSNHILTEFDRSLRSMMYRAATDEEQPAQGALEGIEPHSDLPLLRSTNLVQPLRLVNEYVGYTLTIDRGLGGGSNIVVTDCLVGKLRADCKQGGTVELGLRVQASRVSERTIGQLAMLIGSETSITLTAPEERQAAIDGSTEAFERDHPPADDDEDEGGDDEPEDATSAFVRGAQEAGIESVEIVVPEPEQAAAPAAKSVVHWPFPQGQDSETPAQASRRRLRTLEEKDRAQRGSA